jgi:hypothetical protein
MLLLKTCTYSVPATIGCNSLLRKCQLEYFASLGVKWDNEEWRLFMEGNIPLPDTDKQLWECDLEQSVC